LTTPELRQRQALALLARDELWQQRRHLREAAGQYLVLGAFGMLICGAWVYLGAQTTVAMNIALIYTASPVLIAVGAAAFLGDRLAPRQMAGVLLALAGVMHVVVRGHWLALSEVTWVAGDGWIVLAVVSWALYALLQKKWPSPLNSTLPSTFPVIGDPRLNEINGLRWFLC
jgi:drug/metabolite transporter (DMT)-like permease